MDNIEFAKRVRKDVLNMTYMNKSSHIGSALSIVELLTVLYNDILKYDIKNPQAKDRDRFILSKGHAGVSLYATLAEIGFFSTDILKTHYTNGSHLSGHVSHKNIPGVEISTGSLGHGVSIATGIALAGKLNQEKYRVFVIAGDGEMEEGTVWESIIFASHKNLDNLYLIVDHNKFQSLDTCENTIGFNNISSKIKPFGWEVVEVDGHNIDEIKNSILSLKSKKPKCIIANTIKGKGISFMENKIEWHYKSPNKEQFEQAITELL